MNAVKLHEMTAPEMEQFIIFMHAVDQAVEAGMDFYEAMDAIYPDVYPDDVTT